MKIPWTQILAAASFGVGLIPPEAEACIGVYLDSNVNAAQQEVDAWAWIEDCEMGYPYYEHQYHASVNIESPTENSASDADTSGWIPYGGGSAYAFTTISTLDDPGDYVVEWLVRILCSVVWNLFEDSDIDTRSVGLIEYTMFIPLDHVLLPPPIWDEPMNAGDGYYTYFPGNDYRIQQRIFVDFNLASPTAVSFRDSGTTLQWDPAIINGEPNPEFLSDSLSCFRKFCSQCDYPLGGGPFVVSGYCKTNADPECALDADDMPTINAAVVDTTANSFTVGFWGDPDNACVTSWAISWHNEITFSWDGQAWSYSLEMDHDGFPSHDVSINFANVYWFDPIDEDQSPASLGIPREIEAVITGPVP